MKRNLILILLSFIVITSFEGRAESRLGYVLTRARQLQEKREFAAASKLLDRYIDNPPSKLNREDSIDMTELLRLQGHNFLNLGVSSRAADLFEQALKIAEATGQTKQIAHLSNELFIIALNSGNLSMSSDLLNRSLELYRSMNDKLGEGKILNNMGILYYKQGKYDESLKHYRKSYDIIGPDTVLRSVILINIAENYSALGDYQTADRYLDQAIDLRGHRYDDSDALQAWLNKAGLQANLGNGANAREILRTIGARIDLRDPDRLVESYTQMAKIYMSLGDSILGLRWGLKAQQIADSLNTKQENEQLREILVRYNSERVAEHNKILELNIKRQTQLNRVMVILISLVIAFALFLIFRIRSDRRKNKLIREQREQLLELERMEHDRKEKEFREELDYKNRQLTAYSIDAASISELHKIMIDSLRKLRFAGDQGARNEINEIISRLQNFNRKEVNEDFRVYFNEVHPDFLKRLSEKFPALTPNDHRLCSYLYLGMSTKEIAALTFREIRSVESSRLRLRKKLGITGDTTLHDFLHTV